MYTVRKKIYNWAALLNMWSCYLFDVCIRKIDLCAFLIYGRQADRVENNKPWQPTMAAA